MIQAAGLLEEAKKKVHKSHNAIKLFKPINLLLFILMEIENKIVKMVQKYDTEMPK